MELNKIYQQDCLEFMRQLDSDSIDLIVTSPPYNKGAYADKNAKQSSIWGQLEGRKIAYDVYDDAMPPEEYENWQREVLTECMRVIKPTGSIFYNHKDVINKGVIVVPKWVYDFPVRQQIIWDRGSGPMCDPRYFMPANEWIYWIVKDPKKVFFDKSKSAFRTNIWRMNVERNPHPAPFPTLMAENIIACASPLEGTIYDPFMGSGTTALATIKIGGGRNYLGTELSSKYIEMAEQRINLENAQLKLF